MRRARISPPAGQRSAIDRYAGSPSGAPAANSCRAVLSGAPTGIVLRTTVPPSCGRTLPLTKTLLHVVLLPGQLTVRVPADAPVVASTTAIVRFTPKLPETVPKRPVTVNPLATETKRAQLTGS